MSAKGNMDRFIVECPLAVMTRVIIGEVIGRRFDTLFEPNRGRNYDRDIHFTSLAMSVAEIALGMQENRNQAYKKYKDELQASRTAYYGKLNRVEPQLSEAAVSFSAEQASEMLQQLGSRPWEVLPGYRAYSLDGNHLQKTEKRLKETRGLCAAPLPGTIVAKFDHQTELFTKCYLLEDAHAQEASVLDRVIEDLRAKDLMIADRHFCIVKFLLDIAARSACFLIRQHGRLKGELLGKRKEIGEIDSGTVYEQLMVVGTSEQKLIVRRVTICLHEATRDGDLELHLLSNVPVADACACELASVYRRRWEIENAFYILTMTLNCEMSGNCYPRAALFQFCMAIVAYNCRQVLMAALYAEHAQEDVEEMSQFQVAKEIVTPMAGMLIALNEEEWSSLTPVRSAALAAFLKRVSSHVKVQDLRKSKRGPKVKQPPRKRCKTGTHVSVAKLLNAR